MEMQIINTLSIIMTIIITITSIATRLTVSALKDFFILRQLGGVGRNNVDC